MTPAYLFQYAGKSILRQKSRNAFIISIVALMSFFALFTASLFEGKNKQLEDAIIGTHTGVWQIVTKKYFQSNNPQFSQALNPELVSQLAGLNYSAEVLLETTILHPGGAEALTLIGIDFDQHEKVFPLRPYLTPDLSAVNNDQIIIGRKFAERLFLSEGEELTITYQDKNKALLNHSLKVTSIYRHFGEAFEGSYAFVDRSFLTNLIALPGSDAFHRLVIRPQSKNLPPMVTEDSLLLKSWRDLNPELSILMNFYDGITNILFIFMLVIAFIAIVTPIHILWEGRTDEIRMLRTIGAGKKILLGLGACESLFLTLLALGIALFFSFSALYLAGKYGIDFSLLNEKDTIRGGIVISSVVRPMLNYWHLFIVILFNFLILFGCNFWCIWKTAKKVDDEL